MATREQTRNKIKRYFRNRHSKGKGSWAENHDLAMDMQRLLGVLPKVLHKGLKK